MYEEVMLRQVRGWGKDMRQEYFQVHQKDKERGKGVKGDQTLVFLVPSLLLCLEEG